LRRWNALASCSLADPASVYVGSNALFYKFFEHWSIGKGVGISHIVNSGRSLGDAR
jgi:hypothetical protein